MSSVLLTFCPEFFDFITLAQYILCNARCDAKPHTLTLHQTKAWFRLQPNSAQLLTQVWSASAQSVCYIMAHTPHPARRWTELQSVYKSSSIMRLQVFSSPGITCHTRLLEYIGKRFRGLLYNTHVVVVNQCNSIEADTVQVKKEVVNRWRRTLNR